MQQAASVAKKVGEPTQANYESASRSIAVHVAERRSCQSVDFLSALKVRFNYFRENLYNLVRHEACVYINYLLDERAM